MNLLTRFLAQSPKAPTKPADESYIQLTLILGKHVKRSLTGPELSAVWSLDNEQTSVITNLLKEAKNNGEVQNNKPHG